MLKKLFYFIIIVLLLYLLNVNNFSYVYHKNFLNKNDFNIVMNEIDQINNINFEKSNNVERYNDKLNSPKIQQILQKYTNKINKLTNNYNIYLATNFPIEYRKYIKDSFMSKHKDTILYTIPQYECILTLTNSTDSYTIFDDKKIRPEINSLVIVQAGGIEHQVTKVTKGERKFIKFIFTETDTFI